MNLIPFRRTHTSEPATMSRAERLVRSRKRARRARATIAAFVMVGGGVVGVHAAAAYFKSTGSGTGSGSAGTLVAPTGVTATATSKLVPGGTADLSVTLTNSNGSSIRIVGISQGGTFTAPSGCTNPAVTVPTQTLSLPITVPAGLQTVTIPSSLAMGVGSTNDCQNATFTNIPIALAIQAP